MSVVISKQDVIGEIDIWIQSATNNETDMAIKEFLSFLKERIDMLPSADAEEVIRCKDCQYRRENWGMGDSRWCDFHGTETRSDDFCSYGERREP